ncbi:metalloprotease m41 ftsh [Aspergillus coremiiformis]|uniref:Metalloprotease m41 ftsh n=1 Tax=Aspergillus coremiiformis TaxID=138285 RepID=A0A5N6Z3P8_9EURO|nr:metalloprotease m41 ftsh [Aspergillus coremiiformis]
MEEEIANLRRQIKAEEQRRKKAERRLQSNTLFGLLEGCHRLLSQAIQIETKSTLTTQGDTTKPANRLFPSRILPWVDFPDIQEEIWATFDSDPAFTAQRPFPSNFQLEYVRSIVKRIYSENSLRDFERYTVDNIMEMIVDVLAQHDTLRRRFRLEGTVTFEDPADPEGLTETSLEEAVEDVHGKAPAARPARRRNRSADQFCVYVVAGERRIPTYAVEFKAPHKLTLPELIAGLHEMEPGRDVINKEGETFEFHSTHLVAAVITQIFSYMIDSGVQYGYITTGEAFVFLHIPKDPTTVYYYLSVPNRDVAADDDYRLHRTAIGQVLAFTLNALAAERPRQEWYDTAQENLSTWQVKYLNVLRDIPPSVRKEPPSSVYKSPSWKSFNRSPYNTRCRASCNAGRTTPEQTSGEGRGSENDPSSPSPAAAPRGRQNCGRIQVPNEGSQRQPDHSSEQRTSHPQGNDGEERIRQYCTMECIRGLIVGGCLHSECPNVREHGSENHLLTPKAFTRRLNAQLKRNREDGIEQLHIRGRTGFLLKATLLSHGYTVVVKATTVEKEHSLRAELDTYRHLRPLQGQQIPVCVGAFRPRISYWYHGELMSRMMILSWSGIRAQNVINPENSSFFHSERDRLLAILQTYGIVHRDSEWRNILWNDAARCLVLIDFEDVKWLTPPPGPLSGNIVRRHRPYEQASGRPLLPAGPLFA